MHFRSFLLIAVVFNLAFAVAVRPSSAQPPPNPQTGQADLNNAYQALADKDYDSAIDLFLKGLAKEPGNAAAHKDLAYTLFRAGENAAARDEFEQALQAQPARRNGRPRVRLPGLRDQKAHRSSPHFDRLRKTGNPTTRATAEQAFQNIDRPLADGIARWKQALARSDKPNDLTMFSAHWELAQLAELRDDLPLAAEQYEICREVEAAAERSSADLARVWQQLNRVDESRAATWLRRAPPIRGPPSSLLETLGPRYPYPYEFLAAIRLDPSNVSLRRELGYLYLAMHRQPEAIEQFEHILELESRDEAARDQINSLRGLKVRPAAIPAPPVVATGADVLTPRAWARKVSNSATRAMRSSICVRRMSKTPTMPK